MKKRTVSIIFLCICLFLIFLSKINFNLSYLSRENLSWQHGRIENYLGIKNSFDDIVLRYYKENIFNNVTMVKHYNDQKYEVNNTVNKETANKALDYFKTLKLKEDRKNEMAPNMKDKYDLTFYNKSTNENLSIHVIDNENIEIFFKFVDKDVDEQKRITINKGRYQHGIYRIIGTQIDCDYLDNLFSMMENKLK